MEDKKQECNIKNNGTIVMNRNYSEQCKKCPVIIYGFTKKDLDYKILMHNMKHRKEEKKEEVLK